MAKRFTLLDLLINVEWLLVERRHTETFVGRFCFVCDLDFIFVWTNLANEVLEAFSL